MNMIQPNSAMELLLKHTPDSLERLFDQCISSHCGYEQINGKIFFDLFLFHPPKRNHLETNYKETTELTLPQILVTHGKQHFLTHPLFETFIKVNLSAIIIFKNVSNAKPRNL